MRTKRNGISLIVLAITIIVMIILASAIILSLNGKNVIGSAKEATAASDLANAKHAVAVARGEYELDEVDKSIYTTLKSYAEAKLLEAGLTGFNVSSNGTVTVLYKDADGEQALIPEGYVASEATGEDKISTGLVIYEGTEAVTDANVLEARLTRNQYVWVPVPKDSEFIRKDWGSGFSTNDTTSYNMGDTKESEEYLAMYDSVKENGGFFIARYELAVEGNSFVSRKNMNPTMKMYGITYYKEGFAKLSSDSVQGHLIYGEEWDAALNFIEKTDADYPTNSGGKGNYAGSKLKTGSSDTYAKNNIYDMAGNCNEITMELKGSSNVGRGGYYSSQEHSAALRADTSFVNPTGFRGALYLK